ncbi:oxygen-independent coproporphyrinogen III oxidase [Herbaspirillum sp. CF444]|uniref:oxygen-independent coproporphyrinogen III oxidase n=1 Tax=Herbaspirillum sp. CF444 TaxID=1144319 RepID=UPI000272404D|nr:oxygen-independent coproporphyrinogen III oxidase [Herbaspirillum sp. CF444]EJL87003.1 oxygen-independent coproporphyrinogen III oxidase [Herbaspirillum sp. CF444]
MVVSAMPMVAEPSVEFDAQLVRKLSQSGPRYTSYPTADRFSDAFGYRDYLQAVSGLRTRGSRNPLSLYVHIPFCENICYYCACNKIITRNRDKAATYLSYLKHEIEMQGKLFDGMNQVEQLHLGGGTPTYISDAQMADLMAHLQRWFRFAGDEAGEYSIEVDPRTVSAERVASLRRQGFNRLSLGVQDFDTVVQKAVNRLQPEHLTLDIIRAARDADYRSVSIDLIYGLPGQNVIGMAQTLNKVIRAAPDRISLYNYAHLPHLFKPQRRIDEQALPGAEARLDMLALGIRRLTDAGYVYIGMDHFALPDDDLAIAQQQGRLHRNFQGYSTHAESDMVACGVSAISAVASTYSQNVKTLDAYYDAIDGNELPIVRGMQLSMDDVLRRLIIQRLMCNFELSIASVETAYPITFGDYFGSELESLHRLAQDGLVTIDDEWITVTTKGRLLIRNICMVFDRHLRSARQRQIQPQRYSRTI